MRSKKPFSGCCVEMVKDGSFIVKLLLLSCFFLVSKGLVFDEMGSLLAFKNSSVEADPKGFLKTWSFSDKSPCEWSGVYCSVNGGVTELNLTNGGLKGQIQISHLLALPSLVKLHFGGNSFYGNLSLKVQSSSSCVLEVLDLSENNLSEPLALDALLQSCGHLSLLNLSGNSIPGGSLKFGGSLLQLDLSANKVSDFELLSYSLENCQNLRLMNFSGNSFSGKLNVNFSSCQSLQILDLSHNNFTEDSIGFGSCPNLTVLNLSYNGFSGFPSGLSNCLNLEAFDVGHNDMSLMIPGDELGKLKNLKKLVLSNNQFFGEIPGELGELCGGLMELDLSMNQMSGGVPTTLASCSSLISLSLGHNRLSGDFLTSVVSSFKNLRYLSVSFNNITGPVPRSLKNSTQLQVLDLSSNGFSGNVPSWLCSETLDSGLEKLMLSGNFLEGTIPPELGNCRSLKTIDLSFNFLTGAIPREIWTLPNLSDLIMWANSLSGEIPEGICSNNLRSLQTLILNNNVISGSLPESLGNCTNLIWISLSGNRLSGSIPSGIANLVNLAIFQLGNNSLSGLIPPEIGQCKSLIWLDLNSNNLSGAIPSELADQSGFILPGAVSGKKFAFVRNEGGTACRGAGGLVEFEGIRDERMANLSIVHSCPTTRIYSGKTVYTFSSNGSMIYLDLSYNSFSGSIPEKLGLIRFIQVLNLGHNALTGTIPNTFGGLRSLGVLDLSHNNLHGSIPWPLGGLTFLNDFDVSNNNLSGPIPTGGQLTTFPSSRYQNNSGLCGLPLESCSSVNARRGSSHSGSRKQPVAVGIAIGIAFSLCTIFLLIFALYRISRRQRKEENKDKYINSLPTSGSSSWKISSVVEPLSINVATFEKPLRKLTFAHLLEATNGFSSASLIGSGGFGEVYKAELGDGTIVAIKKLIHVTGQGDREFMAEMETIGKIKHRNLVPLLGYCKIGEERLLVYEYMKHGSLESVLHESARVLDWGARKKIAIGSARGLAFLHHSCIPHIIHRDMKSSNVLIDEDFQARVSDFGMARLVNALDTHLSVSTLAGTPGYVPPEYYQSFRCTAKGDVYSYGVILLELLSGKKPIDTLEFGDDNNLVGWAKQLCREKRSREILDREIVSSSCLDEVLHYLTIAFQCLDDKAFRRPTMIQVMAMFKDLQVDSGSDILDGISVKSSVIDEMQEKDVS